MSGDREARAVGAAETFEVDGKEYKVRPVSIRLLCDLEREALAFRKRQYLRTFRENADLLPEGRASSLLEEKMIEVAGWTLEDLPKKVAFDASRVPITKGVRRWIEQKYGEVPEKDAGVRALLAVALDGGDLTPAEVKKMSGRAPLQGNVRYDQWWITGCMEGMVAFVHASLRSDQPEVTKEEVASWPVAKVAEAARIAEGVTSASMGNG